MHFFLTKIVLVFFLLVAMFFVGASIILQKSHAQVDSFCKIISTKQLNGNIGGIDWAKDGKRIAYSEADTKGIMHLYTANPDGSSPTSLSQSSLPNLNVLDEIWSPDSQWIVVQRENADSLPVLTGTNGTSTTIFLEANGTWVTLYAVSSDGSKWYQLTKNTHPIDGFMAQFFSRDGKHLLYSELTEAANTNNNPWGTYRLMLSDFVVNNGVASLQNIRDITPNIGGHFFEAHGFSPDGKTVLFASDAGIATTQASSNLNIWSVDLTSGKATNLNPGNWDWNEHWIYDNDGNHLVGFRATGILTGELFQTNPDGSNLLQISHFNTPGFPESVVTSTNYSNQGMALGESFNPDGTQALVPFQLTWKYPQTQLWKITYAGSCGGQLSGAIPSLSPVPSNGLSPTVTSLPSPTQGATTQLFFHVFLHGIGKGGDNVNQNSTGNMNPQNKSLPFTISLTDLQNNPLTSFTGGLFYDLTTGEYQGTITVPQAIHSGQYIVKIKTDKFLVKKLATPQTITQNQTVQVPLIYLTSGDINGDNIINILDYNLLIGCYSDFTQAPNCDASRKQHADLNDDGQVNQFDYNLFLREITTEKGD